MVGQLQQLLQDVDWHEAEQPKIENQVMHCINDKLVQADIFNPTSCLEIPYEDPGRNNQNIADEHSQEFVFQRSLAPLIDWHFSVAETYAKDSAYPGKKRGSLEKVEPWAYYLIIPIIDLIVVMVSGAFDVVPDPVDVQENILT